MSRRPSLEAYARREILAADLSSLLLDLAKGRPIKRRSRFQSAPAGAPSARLLVELGAIDAQGRITDEGRKLRIPVAAARPYGGDAAAQGTPARADIAAIPERNGGMVSARRIVSTSSAAIAAARRGCARRSAGGRCRGGAPENNRETDLSAGAFSRSLSRPHR
jgi:hypothetical protein